MDWQGVVEFFKPSKSKLIIFLLFETSYLFLALLGTYVLYGNAAEFAFIESLAASSVIQDALNNTLETDSSSVLAYAETMDILDLEIKDVNSRLLIIEQLKSLVYPGNDHIVLVWNYEYSLQGWIFASDLVVDSSLAFQVIVMLVYWYLLSAAITYCASAIRKASVRLRSHL